jgi:TPR repeat protein
VSTSTSTRATLSAAVAVGAAVVVVASLAALYGPPPIATSAFWWSLPTFLCALPFAAACVLVGLRRTRSFGLAFACSIGLVGLVPIVLAALFSLGFTGFSGETRALVVVGVACLTLVAAGISGWQAMPRAQRSAIDWGVAPLVAASCAGLVAVGGHWAGGMVRQRSDDVAREDRAMESLMASYGACRQASSALCPLPTAPTHQVYAIAATVLCAEPKDAGPRAFVVGPDGRLHSTPPSEQVQRRPARCFEALPLLEEGALRVLVCAARQRKATGAWPEHLDALAAAEPGCVPIPAGKLFYDSRAQSLGFFRGLRGAEVVVVSRAPGHGARYADSNGRAFAFESALPSSSPARAGHPEPTPRVRPAPETLEPGCAAGDAEACADLAADTFDGDRGRVKDRERGRELWDQACRRGSGRACFELGSRGRHDWPKGAVMSSDEQLRRTRFALTNYERACDLGYLYSCASAGNILARGEAIPNDVRERLRARAREEGRKFEPPPPIAPDPERARVLLGKACDDGDRTACADLARSDPAPGRAEDLCGRGDAIACVILAKRLTASGPGQDEARARELFLLACDYDPSDACLEAARLVPEHAPELTARAARAARPR